MAKKVNPMDSKQVAAAIKCTAFGKVDHFVWNFWKSEMATIILDGHHPDTGQRIYIVSENIAPYEAGNALVLGKVFYDKIMEGVGYEK